MFSHPVQVNHNDLSIQEAMDYTILPEGKDNLALLRQQMPEILDTFKQKADATVQENTQNDGDRFVTNYLLQQELERVPVISQRQQQWEWLSNQKNDFYKDILTAQFKMTDQMSEAFSQVSVLDYDSYRCSEYSYKLLGDARILILATEKLKRQGTQKLKLFSENCNQNLTNFIKIESFWKVVRDQSMPDFEIVKELEKSDLTTHSHHQVLDKFDTLMVGFKSWKSHMDCRCAIKLPNIDFDLPKSSKSSIMDKMAKFSLNDRKVLKTTYKSLRSKNTEEKNKSVQRRQQVFKFCSNVSTLTSRHH